jgi:hypothetical protein
MVIKEVKDTPSFMNCWRNCGINQETSGFKSWGDVEDMYKFKFILGTSIRTSTIEFETEEAYTMFLLKWS